MASVFTRRGALFFALGLTLSYAWTQRSFAQPYPTKPVRLVLSVPPGGLQDQLARGLAADLAKGWSQPVLVENRPGAAGNLAIEAVARAAPDGYNILQMDNITWLTNEFLRKDKPAFDL